MTVAFQSDILQSEIDRTTGVFRNGENRSSKMVIDACELVSS